MSEENRMRLDIWLWRTRFYKARTTAGDAISRRAVRIERNGLVRRIDKPSASVMADDLLSFTTEAGSYVVRVRAMPERRGPAPEAALCYELVEHMEPSRPSSYNPSNRCSAR